MPLKQAFAALSGMLGGRNSLSVCAEPLMPPPIVSCCGWPCAAVAPDAPLAARSGALSMKSGNEAGLPDCVDTCADVLTVLPTWS